MKANLTRLGRRDLRHAVSEVFYKHRAVWGIDESVRLTAKDLDATTAEVRDILRLDEPKGR